MIRTVPSSTVEAGPKVTAIRTASTEESTAPRAGAWGQSPEKVSNDRDEGNNAEPRAYKMHFDLGANIWNMMEHVFFS